MVRQFLSLEFYGLVIHHSIGGSDVASGRNNHNLSCTTDSGWVTCKSCLRSLAKLVLAPPPAPAEDTLKTSYEAPSKQNDVSGFCFKASWQVRLVALPNRCHLPRGSAAQSFV